MGLLSRSPLSCQKSETAPLPFWSQFVCRLPLVLLCIELLAFSLPLPPLALVRLRIRKPTQPASAATPTPYFDTCRTLELLPPSTPQLFTLASQRHPAGSSSSFNDRPVPSHHRRRSSAGSHSLSEVRAGNLLSIHPRTANQAQLSPIVGTSSHRRLGSLAGFPRRLPCVILCRANFESLAG